MLIFKKNIYFEYAEWQLKGIQTINKIYEYNKNRNLIKEKIYYQEDGKTINYINEYDNEEKLIKTIIYQEDGKNIDRIYEYNKYGDLFKIIYYKEDSKTIDYII